ncbi:hypothetical protein O181_039442 [Austropuccinia psidii MF-1]|uniref:Integrase catalytic domain-containing protein n=1 Tax=Austropuccinia psidii MF-1 TaxID=1389203 RepID=A0A9Q3DGT7_9BASI|nr:hypothetical protein [Austropuccinia psidii MF-1]
MIHIQNPNTPWEVVHMDWVTALPHEGDTSYNEFPVIVDRYSKTPIFLPCNRDYTAMDTALLIWNRVISHTGLCKNMISDRDPKFTSALCTNLHKLLGTKLLLPTAYHPQTDGLAERMIQTLEDMSKRFCTYGLQFKDSDGFTHYCCTPIPAFLIAYKTSIHASTVSHHGNQSINEAFEYAKQKWDKSHKTPEFKLGDLKLVLILNFNNIEGPKKLKYTFTGPFIIKALHGTNAVQAELSGESENKHPTFPVSLVKHYTSSDEKLFPFGNETPLEVPPLDESEEKKVLKVLK